MPMLIDAILIFFLVFALLLLITAVVNMISGAPSVPSNRRTIALMLQEAKLKKGQTIYDLGCGDGRLLIRAEKLYGTQGVGYENAPITLILGLFNKLIHCSKIKFRFTNFFKADLSKAHTIFLYLGPEAQQKLAPKIKKECKKGTTIICNTFHLPGFKEYKKIPKDKKARTNTIYIYKI